MDRAIFNAKLLRELIMSKKVMVINSNSGYVACAVIYNIINNKLYFSQQVTFLMKNNEPIKYTGAYLPFTYKLIGKLTYRDI